MKRADCVPELVISENGGEVWSTPQALRDVVLKQPYWLQAGKPRVALDVHDAIDTANGHIDLTDETMENVVAAARTVDLRLVTSRYARFFLRVVDKLEVAYKPPDPEKP